jgi:opacity protein-like surface antigen
MKLINKVLIITAAAAISTSVFSSPYVELDLGASIPFNSMLGDRAEDASYKPTVALTTAFGYALNQNLRVDLEYGYQEADIERIAGVYVDREISLTVHTVLANGYYNFRNSTKITPFIGGGVGAAFLEGNSSSGSASDTVLAYQGTAGAFYSINEHLALTCSYRYLGTEDGAFGWPKASFSSNLVRLGMAYSF